MFGSVTLCFFFTLLSEGAETRRDHLPALCSLKSEGLKCAWDITLIGSHCHLRPLVEGDSGD